MAAKNNNYSYKKMSNILAPNNDANTIAVAEDIAFEWTDTTTDELGQPKFVNNKTIKLKIIEIDNTLDNILSGVGSISEAVSQAVTSANEASQAKEAALEAKTEVINYKDSIETKVNNITDTLRDLSTSFDADARILIIGESAYEALSPKDPNTMYFLYDDSY